MKNFKAKIFKNNNMIKNKMRLKVYLKLFNSILKFLKYL